MKNVELRELAEQCISHPVSRSISEIEQAGTAILALLDRVAHLEATGSSNYGRGMNEAKVQEVMARVSQLECSSHRIGELFERCQGKGWPQAEADEFVRLRDEVTPARRAAIEAALREAPAVPGDEPDVLHASVIKKIWSDCKNEGLDYVAFAWRVQREAYRAMLSAAPQPAQADPIDMVLHCPACGTQHIDAPEPDLTVATGGPHSETKTHVIQKSRWTNPPHRSHLCHDCGYIWRPADVPTNGVQAVKTRGKADSPVEQPAQAERCPNCDGTGDVHSIDGQWRGSCHCPAGQKPAQAEQPTEEQAPPNSLPSWDECALRMANSAFIEKRGAGGGYGAEPDSKTATQLHRFIYEYDDSDPYRSAWFLHRLELVLNEARTEQPKAAQQEPVLWAPPERDGEFHHRHESVSCYREEKAGWVPHYAAPQQRKPLSDAEHEELMRGKSTLEYGRAIEAAHNIGE